MSLFKSAGRLSLAIGVWATAIALSTPTSAALFVAYGGGGIPPAVTGNSAAIDFGVVVPTFSAVTTLGITLSADSIGGTLTEQAGKEDLQVVQGCLSAAALCDPGGWFDITGQGLSLGDHTQANPDTEVYKFASGPLTINTPVQSLRLAFAGDLAGNAGAGFSGTLEVTPIPEPGIWAMILAGILGVGAIARRRIEVA